jgi:predicted dehydrogenase
VTALRVALVGTGDAGHLHARALCALHAEGVLSFAAVVGRDAARAQTAAVEFGAPPEIRAFGSLDELLAANATDVVILATPDGLHAAQTIACLQAGLHVLCEKPLALSSADARRAVEAAHAAHRALSVGYHLRHHAGHVAIRAQLAELVGTMRAIDLRWAWPDPARDGWRAHGTNARWWSLAALGTHMIDLVLWLTDATPTDVRALISSPPGATVDHAAEVVLRMPSGMLVHVACAITHRETPWLLVAGDLGEVEARDTLGARGTGMLGTRHGREATVPLTFTPVDPYLAQLRAFVARIAAGDVAPDRDAVTNVDILEQIAASN